MTDHVYKSIEITGSSGDGIEQAITAAVERASESLHNLRWFEVTDIRGQLEGSKIDYWQVTLKVGFTLDEGSSAGD
ncbi:MAG: dodecin family protein [Gammaproteobacteria bacterium]|jgi:flavin-binding protein dodecin